MPQLWNKHTKAVERHWGQYKYVSKVYEYRKIAKINEYINICIYMYIYEVIHMLWIVMDSKTHI